MMMNAQFFVNDGTPIKVRTKKIGLKDYVNYFDFNCRIQEVESHYDLSSSTKPNFFKLEYCLNDLGSGFKFVYGSQSFEACKRHMKAHFVSSEILPLFYRIVSFYRSPTGLNTQLGYSFYYLTYHFECHEYIC